MDRLPPGLFVLVWILAAYVVGLVLYVATTHALVLVRREGVGLGALLRQVIVEVGWLLLVQPLIPAFFFLGRRLGQGSGGVPVVFIHGYGQNRGAFVCLARRLRRARVGAMYGFNYSWLRSLDEIAESLDVFVARVLAETGAPQVDLVCHSMGGLVAMQFLRREQGLRRARRVVTLGSPHRGVAYKGPIPGRAAHQLKNGHGLDVLPDRPVLSIYSDGDTVVFPKSTSHLEGPRAENHELSGLGHFSLLCAEQSSNQVVSFLEREPGEQREA